MPTTDGYNGAYTGPQIDEGISKASTSMQPSVYDPQNKAQDVFAYADTKQSRLTGTAGQIVGFDGDGNAAAQDPEGAWYGTCSTSSSIEEKVVECIGFTLKTGAQITVFFTYDNNISYPTLNVNGTGAYAIRRTTRDGNNNIGEWQSGEAIHFVFNGTYWLMTGRGTATTTYHGVTKLSISVTDTATNMAATPFAVKTAYDAATVAATAAEEAQGSIDRHMDDADAHVTAEDRAAWNGRLPLSGGTMTGPLTLSGDPTEDLQAAPKQYVDALKPKPITITLPASGWSNNQQTVTATGVTADNAVTPSPAPASWEAAGAAGVRCTAQGADSLTFACSEPPAEDLTYNVLIQEVQ